MNKISQLLLLVLSASIGAYAASAGALDPTFGTGGKVFNLPANFIQAFDVAIQPDGKLVLVGVTRGPDNTDDFGIVRLNTDGSPDMGFGTNGLVGVPFDANFTEQASAVVIQSDGKIVVAGSVELGSSGWDFGVVRLNSNGTLDGTYSGGKVKVAIALPPLGGDDFARDMIIQPDNKVVIVGTTRPTPNNDIGIVRLATTGVVDGAFRVRVDIGSGGNDEAYGIALQSDGSMVVAGTTAGDFCLLRFLSTGGIDTNFGLGGLAQLGIGTQGDVAYSVAIQADGKIVAAGKANSGSHDEIGFARFTSAGQPDPTFDGDGKALFDVIPMESDEVRKVLIQPDGKIIGVGRSAGRYIIVRLTTTGALDPTFGVGGKVIQNVAPLSSSAYSAILQPDGKIVAVGDGGGPPLAFTAARFLTVPAPTTPFDFDGDRKTDIGIFRPADGTWWINRSLTGATTATAFGTASDRLAPADYTGDGKTDIAVWRPSDGNWLILRSEDSSFYAFPFGANGDVPVPADYDGDGKADAAVYRSGVWFIFRSSDGGVTIQQFGIAGDIPVTADYDGDGKSDLAIFRPADGVWWLNRSTAGIIAIGFGTSTDKLTPGDFTGDGKADIAYWRPSTGDWAILRSEDFSFFAFPFGANGDIPAPGDYDGDGKFDATVFRPSTATWFSFRSTGGVDIRAFGVTGDRPIPNAFVP